MSSASFLAFVNIAKPKVQNNTIKTPQSKNLKDHHALLVSKMFR